MRDTRPVYLAGGRHLLQRQLAAARHGGSQQQPGTSASPGTDADAGLGTGTCSRSVERNFMHHAGPVRLAWGRRLLQRQLAAARDGASRQQPGASPGTGASADSTRAQMSASSDGRRESRKVPAPAGST